MRYILESRFLDCLGYFVGTWVRIYIFWEKVLIGSARQLTLIHFEDHGPVEPGERRHNAISQSHLIRLLFTFY